MNMTILYPQPPGALRRPDVVLRNDNACFVTIVRLTTTASNTEERFTIPARTIELKIRNTSGDELRVDFAADRVAATTAVIPKPIAIAPFVEKDFGRVSMTADTTLYYASNLKGAEFEIEIHQE